MDALAVERLHKSALLQKSVRKIVSTCIALWMDTLQLEDKQIEPDLAHLRSYCSRFEVQYGGMEQARAGKQWVRLKIAVLGKANVKNTPTGKEKIKRGPTTRGGTYTPSKKIISFHFLR